MFGWGGGAYYLISGQKPLPQPLRDLTLCTGHEAYGLEVPSDQLPPQPPGLGRNQMLDTEGL
jgi:hypothetical protein